MLLNAKNPRHSISLNDRGFFMKCLVLEFR